MLKSIQKDSDKRKLNSIYLKDVLQERSIWIDMARKMADLYEELLDKHSFFRMAIDKIFE